MVEEFEDFACTFDVCGWHLRALVISKYRPGANICPVRPAVPSSDRRTLPETRMSADPRTGRRVASVRRGAGGGGIIAGRRCGVGSGPRLPDGGGNTELDTRNPSRGRRSRSAPVRDSPAQCFGKRPVYRLSYRRRHTPRFALHALPTLLRRDNKSIIVVKFGRARAHFDQLCLRCW